MKILRLNPGVSGEDLGPSWRRRYRAANKRGGEARWGRPAEEADSKCTSCGHKLSQHEDDATQSRRYRKFCCAEGCDCIGFRDHDYEPEQ